VAQEITVVKLKRAAWARRYAFDFSAVEEFADGGETISSKTVTASPVGLTVGTSSLTGFVVSAMLSGGTAGVTYTVTCTVVTSGGATLSWDGQLRVEA
jgi:hypothetical protein